MEEGKEQKMQVNLLPFFCEALATNKKIHKDVDNLYQKHKYEFYKAAKEHELYEHQIATEGSLIQEEYFKKVLGIVLCIESIDNVASELSDIIRKGFAYTYLYVNNHNEIDVNKYLAVFEKKNKGLDNISDDELNGNLAVLIVLAMNNNIIINKDNSMYNAFIEALDQRWGHYKGDDETRIGLHKASDIDKKKIKGLKQLIYSKYGRITCFEDILNSKFNEIRSDPAAFLFDYERLSSLSIFEGIKFKDKDIDEILYLYIITYKDEVNSEDALEFLISSMYIKYLIKAYKQVKQIYFKNNKETMFVEFEGIEKELQAAEAELINKDKKIMDMQRKIDQLEKENKRLKSELDQGKENRQELNSLREFVFGLDKQIEYKEAELAYETLKGIKGLAVGGHESWQRKMKEYLPGCRFLAPDKLNFDTGILEGMELVFIYTDYLNHGMYYKLINEIRKKDIKLIYLQGNVNEKLVLQRICQKIK